MKIFVFNFPEDCAIVVNIRTNTTSDITYIQSTEIQRIGNILNLVCMYVIFFHLFIFTEAPLELLCNLPQPRHLLDTIRLCPCIFVFWCSGHSQCLCPLVHQVLTVGTEHHGLRSVPRQLEQQTFQLFLNK